MKFRNALVLGIVLLFAIPAFAQDEGKVELSGNSHMFAGIRPRTMPTPSICMAAVVR
jgi:hypothetical protein